MKKTPQPISTDAAYLSVGQVAALLACSTRTVFRLVAVGSLPPPLKFNRKLVRFVRAEVNAYLAQTGRVEYQPHAETMTAGG